MQTYTHFDYLYKNGGRNNLNFFARQEWKAKLKEGVFVVFPTTTLFPYCNIQCKDIVKMMFCLVSYLFIVNMNELLLSGPVILGYVACFKLNLKPWGNPIKRVKII